MQHTYVMCCVRIVRDLCDAPNMKAVIIRVIYLLLLFQHSCPLVRSFLLQSSCQVLSTLFRSAPGISSTRSEKLLAFCLACFVYSFDAPAAPYLCWELIKVTGEQTTTLVTFFLLVRAFFFYIK